jgi:peptidyl-prolyl cis-trans isomerase C
MNRQVGSSTTVWDQEQAQQRPEPVMPSACERGGCGGPSSNPRLQPAPPSFGIVRVNGVEIEPEAIAEETQHHPAESGEAAWQQAARALAVRELLLQEARRRAITADPETDESGRSEVEEEAVIRALLEKLVEPPAASEEECRRYYDANSHHFRTPDLFEPSHILIEPEGDDAAGWAAAEAEARAIAFEVGNNPEAFAAAAREFSRCPTAHQNGSLGQIRRGELVPSVQEAIEKLAEGTTARDPVRSRFGWHVIRLERRIEGQTLPFEVVKDRIADMLDARAWAVAAARFTAELARSAEIEGIQVDPESLGVN